VVCSLIEEGGRVLVAQRSVTQSLPLKWEFPGGKIEPGETEAEALVREIREELGIEIEVGKSLRSTTHAYPEFSLTLHPRLCRIASGIPVTHEHTKIEWCGPAELEVLDWASADIPILEEYLLLRGFKKRNSE
jgi:8-oxo-dGTP diphosphatase